MNQNTRYRAVILAVLAVAIVGVLAARGPRNESTGGTDAPVPAAAAPKLPRLVDLGADKCIPCKMMAPILEELKREQAGKVDVEFIDVWKNPDAGGQYGIQKIPTQIFFDAEGKEIFRHEGFFAREEILGVFKKHGIAVAEGRPSN